MDLLQELDAVRIKFGRWCPVRDLHLRAHRRAMDTIGLPSARLLAISPQMPDASLSTAEANGIACVVAPDVQAAG